MIVATPAATSSISIAIISKGRPEILDETIAGVFRQSLLPAQVVVVVPTEADLPRRPWESPVELISGAMGICAQRNRALDAIPLTVNYVAFIDDDFEMKSDYLAEAVAFLDRNPGVVGISGLVLVDGNITRAEALRRVEEFQHPTARTSQFQSAGKFHSLYGCNMMIRRSILDYERFDENLTLYAFAEDYDISVRVERYGKVGKFSRCIGVHLATPGGRVREVQRGYMFVANPYYFMQQGVTHLSPFMTRVRFWSVSGGRSCWISFWKMVRRDKSTDWAGRLKGHLLAIRDIMAGRSHPRRAEDLKDS